MEDATAVDHALSNASCSPTIDKGNFSKDEDEGVCIIPSFVNCKGGPRNGDIGEGAKSVVLFCAGLFFVQASSQ